MDWSDDYHLNINKKLLNIYGIWFFDKNRARYFYRSFSFIVVFLGISSQIYSIVINISNLDRVMENLIYALTGVFGVFQMIHFIVAQKKLRSSFQQIMDNKKMIIDEEEIEILQKYSENGRQAAIWTSAIFGSYNTACVLGPLIAALINLSETKSERSYTYTLNGEYWIENKDEHYFKIWFFETLLVYISPFMYVVTDAAFVMCIEHALGLFAIVSNRIRVLGMIKVTPLQSSRTGVKDERKNSTVKSKKDNEPDTGRNKLEHNDDPFYEDILNIIKFHQETQQFAGLLEETFRNWLLIVLIYTLTIFPPCCILIAVKLNNPVQLIKFCGMFIYVIIRLLIICFRGQQLIDVSSSLSQKIYSNDKWLQSSLKSKKALLFFTLQCSKPCKVTAAGLFTMNFENFLSIMKTAVSYIMVLKTVRQTDII